MKYSLHWKQYQHQPAPLPSLVGEDQTNMTAYGYTFDRVIDIEMSPHVDQAAIVGAAVAELRAEQATHTAAITDLDRKIQELMCIEFKQEDQS